MYFPGLSARPSAMAGMVRHQPVSRLRLPLSSNRHRIRSLPLDSSSTKITGALRAKVR